jgi:hypothetical protein
MSISPGRALAHPVTSNPARAARTGPGERLRRRWNPLGVANHHVRRLRDLRLIPRAPHTPPWCRPASLPARRSEETRGGFYVRQLLGAANIDGGPLFHLLAGNLSFQVEHHLYPDMPSSRYAEIAPRVRDICRRYGLPYNTGPLHKQLGTVHRTILRLAFPGGKVRPKPGPYAPS